MSEIDCVINPIESIRNIEPDWGKMMVVWNEKQPEHHLNTRL
jgi:hypothetical protein